MIAGSSAGRNQAHPRRCRKMRRSPRPSPSTLTPPGFAGSDAGTVASRIAALPTRGQSWSPAQGLRMRRGPRAYCRDFANAHTSALAPQPHALSASFTPAAHAEFRAIVKVRVRPRMHDCLLRRVDDSAVRYVVRAAKLGLATHGLGESRRDLLPHRGRGRLDRRVATARPNDDQ